MKVVVLSDVIFPKDRNSVYSQEKLQNIFGIGIYEEILSADINIVNLECVLTEREDYIEKWGSILVASPENIALLKQIPNIVVNLSNNHIFDAGLEGLKDTVRILDDNGIRYLGCTINQKSNRTITFEDDGKMLGFFSCSEHEFNSDDAGNGAILFEPMEAALEISELAKNCDRVIVLYHGGVEFYPYPYPSQQNNLRRMIDAGADLVVCQHNHCVSCEEQYNNGTIVYGQGTLIWGNRPEIQDNILDIDMMNSGMAITYDTVGGDIKRTYYSISGDRIIDSSGDIEEKYVSRSRKVSDKSFIDSEWIDYCKKQDAHMGIFGDTFVDSSPIKTIKKAAKSVVGLKDCRSERLRVYDYLTCESHLEIIRTISKIEKDVKECGY